MAWMHLVSAAAWRPTRGCARWRAERCEAAGIALRVPRPGLCTDNGAMVAALGAELMARGAEPSPLGVAADSALPVTEVARRVTAELTRPRPGDTVRNWHSLR